MESVTERLLKSGLTLDHEWNVNIHIYGNENYLKSMKQIELTLEDQRK